MVTPRAVLAALLLAGLAGPSLSAQEPQRPVFRAKVDAVTLDVTVVDTSGKAVTDLKAEDFEVIEQGTRQKIDTFELVDMSRRPPMESNLYHEIRTMQSQEQELARRESRIFVVLLDDYHVKLADQWHVRNQVGDVVRGLDPRDLVAIMYPTTQTVGLTFSRDHEASARLIEQFEGREGNYAFPKNVIEEEHIKRSGGQPGLMEKFRRDVVRTALQGLCTYLGSLRDSRKSVLFVSDWAPGGITGFEFDDFRQIQREASRGNTAIYTYDPQGLIGRPNQWLQALAEQTGGRATVNTNNGRAGMMRMVSDSEAYYLIGYTSTENARDGKFHNVKVKVKRPGLEIRAKPGYWAYDADALERAAAPLPPPVAADVNAALEAAEAPEQGRPMLAWAGFDRDASGATVVSVVWEASQAARQPIDQAEITAVSDTSTFRGRAKNTVTFPTKPGDLSIRIAAHASDGSPIETGFLSLSVPKPAAVQLATPKFMKGRTARDVGSADALPAATREFSKQDQVVVRAHAWTESGNAATVQARLLSDHGVVLQELAAQADAAAPGNVTIAVPVGGLGLGRYVIEISAADGAASTKALAAFRVK